MPSNGLEVIERTRGHIDVVYGGRKARLPGEMLTPSPGLPNYVIYSAMIKNWGLDGKGAAMTSQEKADLLQQLKAWSASNNYPIDIE
jgi:hypothetical protein